MVHYIKLGGQERPIGFGYSVGLEYELSTGGNYNELVFKIATEAETARDKFLEGDMMGVASAMSIKPITTVIYHGLRFGYRKEGLTPDFEMSDVAEWLFMDQEAIQACITALFESLPRPSGEAATDTKKKTTARPGSTGKALSKQRQR